MEDFDQVKRVISDDGTEIAGRVKGQGPHIVFVHGMMDDGTLQWVPAVSYLADRFTCHVMSARNRGNSGHSEDLAITRLVEDVTAYASSIDEPVGLVGLSAGGTWVLGAASRLKDITGVVAYEPVVFEALNENIIKQLGSVVMREDEEAQQGQLIAAVRIFAEFVGNEEEIAALDSAYFEAMSTNVPADLMSMKQGSESQGPSITDASQLEKIKAPVLLLQGGRTNIHSWFHAGVQYIVENVQQATVHEFSGLGHLGPMIEPKPIAEKIASFFDNGQKR